MKKFLTVEDYRNEANNKLPGLARDYYNGGSEEERTLKRNEKAFNSLLIRPLCLNDVTTVDAQVNWLGAKFKTPIGIAPTAFHKMSNVNGELETLRGAAASDYLMIVSSWSTTSLEEIAAEAEKLGVTLWFQLYVYKDIGITESLIRRAEKCGCKAIVLTVDTPVLGRRLKDIRNGFSLPNPLTFANFTDAAASAMPVAQAGNSAFMDYVSSQIDPALSWKTVKWIKSLTSLPLIVKGIVRPDDAEFALAAGVNGIIVSNHGGRQLDSAPATIESLPEVVRAVSGRCPVFMDGGVRNGRDVFKAVARGAAGVFVGRPILWGLASKGAEGVSDVLQILQKEFLHTMRLAGCYSIGQMQTDKNLVVHKSYFSKL